MTSEVSLETNDLRPTDVTEWLRIHGWRRTGSLGSLAQRWQSSTDSVLVPMLTDAPDFTLRWSEMLGGLAESLRTDQAGVLLAVTKAGSDIAEFRAFGQIDDSLPLGDASTLIDSVRRAMQASANSALQPRSYYGHSLPDVARDHARKVRMGQTRRGSYIVPVISRLPVLQPEDAEDAALFGDITYRPFARNAMLQLAQGLTELRELTHGSQAPTRRRVAESVGRGVSSELCDAVANTLAAESIVDLEVAFTWAERLPVSAPSAVRLESGSIEFLREVSSILKGEPVVGPQTVIGYVKRLDRGEEDEVGRVTLRILDSDRVRNVTLELNDDEYHVAGQANTDRRMVSATGVLRREPGKALRFSDVSNFHLLDDLTSFSSDYFNGWSS